MIKSPPKLTHKQRLFVEYYIGLSSGNATDAARRAGYALPAVQGYENLIKPYIREAVSTRYTEAAMSANEALSRLSAQARASLADALEYVTDPEPPIFDGNPDAEGKPLTFLRLSLEKAVETGLIHNLSAAKYGQYGLEIKLSDTQGALDKILRAHGVYTGGGSRRNFFSLPAFSFRVVGYPLSSRRSKRSVSRNQWHGQEARGIAPLLLKGTFLWGKA